MRYLLPLVLFLLLLAPSSAVAQDRTQDGGVRIHSVSFLRSWNALPSLSDLTADPTSYDVPLPLNGDYRIAGVEIVNLTFEPLYFSGSFGWFDGMCAVIPSNPSIHYEHADAVAQVFDLFHVGVPQASASDLTFQDYLYLEPGERGTMFMVFDAPASSPYLEVHFTYDLPAVLV